MSVWRLGIHSMDEGECLRVTPVPALSLYPLADSSRSPQMPGEEILQVRLGVSMVTSFFHNKHALLHSA